MSTSVTWPGGSTGATATSYNVPAAGELNWSALSNFLVALGQGAQSTVFQLFANRKATSSPVTVAVTDCVVGSKLSVAGAVMMNLPAGANKQIFFLFDDTGDAATNNITISPNGGDTIAGGASLVLNHNREACALCYNSGDTDWKIVYRCAPLGNIALTDLPTISIAKGGTGQTTAATAFNALWPATTTGDTIYSSSGTTAARLAIGANGKYLRAGSSVPGYSWDSVNTVTSANYIVLDTDGYDVIAYTTGNSNRTCTLPASANNAGRMITILKFDSGSGKVTIGVNGADTIGIAATATTYVINPQGNGNGQGVSMTFVLRGTNWDCISVLGNNMINTVTSVAAGNNNVFATITSLTIPPGKWRLSVTEQLLGGATGLTVGGNTQIAIGTGSDDTGCTYGYNAFRIGVFATLASIYQDGSIGAYDIILTTSTTYNFNGQCTYAAGSPLWFATLAAIQLG